MAGEPQRRIINRGQAPARRRAISRTPKVEVVEPSPKPKVVTKKTKAVEVGRLLTIDEVAERLSMTRHGVEHLIRTRAIEHVKMAPGRTGGVRISEHALAAWVAARTVPAVGE